MFPRQGKNQNKEWVTYFIEFNFFEEKLYFSPTLDLFNGEIITYRIVSIPRYNLVKTMPNHAKDRLTDEDKLLFH